MGYLGNNNTITGTQNSKRIVVEATPNQTISTVTGGYTIGQLDVYRNGVKLVSAEDYTARDGSSVTFINALSVSDDVEFVVFENFNVADALGNSGSQILAGSLDASGIITATSGFNIGIQSGGEVINAGAAITTINFVGTGNTLIYNSGTNSVDVAIAGGGGGGVGTAINYADGEKSPFTFIDAYQTVDADLDLDATNAGASTSFVVSVVPNVEISSGVAVTVGSGKTMVIDVLQIGNV
tara:strand:- start:5476 stop:6192 length:717 start_codon:yes stop_codon:yes gene_type:complete